MQRGQKFQQILINQRSMVMKWAIIHMDIIGMKMDVWRVLSGWLVAYRVQLL